MRMIVCEVLVLALIAALPVGANAQNSVQWDADGTKTLTQDGWTLTGPVSSDLQDFSSGQSDAGTNGVWHIADTDSNAKMEMYKNPGSISASQGIVIARVKYVTGTTFPKGTFGYSSASGNHSVLVAVRNGLLNFKSAEDHNTDFNGGNSISVPGGTTSYRVYALAYVSGGVFNVWVSNGTNWSSNQNDWTQLVTNGTWSQGQSALIDNSSQARSGLLMGSYGPRTENWTGDIDYIAWSNQAGEQTPWSFNLSGLGSPGPSSVPGIIQAEDYDQGGEGVAYHDTTAGNSGGAYRNDNVDIENCADTGGGYDVGSIAVGEWLRYTVNATQAGDYDINVRVATTQATGSFHIELNAVNVTGTQTFTGTGGWQTWSTYVVPSIHFNAGQQTLMLFMETGAWNVNYIQVATHTANNAVIVSDTIPTTMTAGQNYNVTVTTQNTGTITWTQANGYKLGAIGDSDPFCAFTRVDLAPSDSIASNQQKTFSFTMTAPSSPGTYTTDWGMLREGVEWFGGTLSKQVQVQASGGANVLLQDPLQGSTIGTRSGGSFVAGGWKVLTGNDFIYWHLPHNMSWGAVEFYISGLISRDPNLPGDSDIVHMYDYTYGPDTDYISFRNNPYKFRLQKHGTVYDYRNLADAGQITWIFPPDDLEYEWDTSVLTWDPAINYKFRLEWGPASGGSSPCRFLRNDVTIWQRTLMGTFTPPGHGLRLGWSLRDADDAPINAIFSNLTVYELSGNAPPGAPIISTPSAGATVNTLTPRIFWTGDAHTSYQVRINSNNDPTTGIVWDSGTVNSTLNDATTGTLSNNTNYYVFVRLQNANGWGSWSATGQWFHIDTSFYHHRYGLVRLNGYSLEDDAGPFLGLGASYFAAMWFCKYDRATLRSDLALLAQGGFTHIRVLSEITGGCGGWWDGKDASPFPYTSDGGCFVNAWPDYDQQFRDLCDIAFDEFGIRLEVVIFGGFNLANVPGGKTTLENHVNRLLGLIQGREQKIAFFEVGNESWQTGFGYPGGLDDMRHYCSIIAAATPVLVAITSPGADFTYQGIYQGSAADLATQHLARDTTDNRWYNVVDAWRLYVEWPAAPPTSSDEPIGPGSSVLEENDPIRLVSAAFFAWTAKLPIYCWHSIAGIRHWDDAHQNKRFEDMAAVNDYAHLAQILPGDLPAWTRNDGKEAAAPFTVFCAGQANKYWNQVPGATDGCYWNVGGIKGNDFVCCPVGILSGGLTLQARRDLSFVVYNPLTGAVVDTRTLTTGQSFTLPQGPQAYIITSAQTLASPVIAEVTPDPDTAYLGTQYVKTLSLATGFPAPTWSLLTAPAGATINSSGQISGWTPSAANIGDNTFTAQAVNSEGADTETWVVRVLSKMDFDIDGDVDQSDFAHLQNCFSGPGIPFGTGCGDADTEGDGDVDNTDFTTFLPCLTGANNTPGC